MRFLDHIPTRRLVIMEAGIKDVAVMLDRLAQEVSSLRQNREEDDYVKQQLSQYARDATAVAQTLTPDINDQETVAMEYSKAMWLAKMIRLQIVYMVDRDLKRSEESRGIIASRVSPSWRKYADKVYRAGIPTMNAAGVVENTPTSFDQYGPMLLQASVLYTQPGSPLVDQFVHYSDMCRVSPEVARVPWQGMNVGAVVNRLSAAEAEWRAKRPQNDVAITGRDKVIISDKELGEDGWFWVYLERSYCSDEANMMGHCGREGGSHLISLRQVTERNEKFQPVAWKSWVTASYNPNEKVIGQVKGPHNSKPGKDEPGQSDKVIERNRIIRKCIAALFNWSEVHGFRVQNYQGHLDFRPDDLEDDLFDTLKDDRPGIYAGSIKGWVKKYGNDITSLINYLRTNNIRTVTTRELMPFSAEAIKEFLGTTDVPSFPKDGTPRDNFNLGELGGEVFAKALGGGEDSLKRFLMTRNGRYMGDSDLQPFDKEAVAKVLEDVDAFVPHAGIKVNDVGPAPYVKCFGQTEKAAKLFLMNRGQSGVSDDNLKKFDGEALKWFWNVVPLQATFRVGNYIRVQKLFGSKKGVARLFAEYAKSDKGRAGLRIRPEDLEALSKRDRKTLYGLKPDLFDMDIYLRTFGTDDLVINALIQDLDNRINDDYLESMEEGTRVPLVDFMIDHAPHTVAKTFQNVLQGYNDQVKIFIYKEYSNFVEMVGDSRLVKKNYYGRDDNAIQHLVGVAEDGPDYDYGNHFGPHGALKTWADDFLSDDELACLVDYVRENYPDECQDEAEDGDIDTNDALKIIEEQGDDVYEYMKQAYEDGARIGYQNDVWDSIKSEISNKGFDGNYMKNPLLIYYDHGGDGQGPWEEEPIHQAKVIVGWGHDSMKNILGEKDLLEGFSTENFEIDDGFYMDERHQHWDFDKDAAWEGFYEAMPESPLETAMKAAWKARQEKKKAGIKESLARRLGWR